MKYYELTEDMYYEGKWYLGSINSLSYDKQYAFSGKPLFFINEKLSIPVKIDGNKTDYTENLGYGIPIVSNKLKLILSSYNVVFSTLKVFQQQKCIDEYYAIGTEILDCINENKSEYTKFVENDPIRPDLAGQYSAIYKIVLDKNKIQNKHIFRIQGYCVCLIVSEEIKNKIEAQSLTGLDFMEVEVY